MNMNDLVDCERWYVWARGSLMLDDAGCTVCLNTSLYIIVALD